MEDEEDVPRCRRCRGPFVLNRCRWCRCRGCDGCCNCSACVCDSGGPYCDTCDVSSEDSCFN